jgi:hypothetical protein
VKKKSSRRKGARIRRDAFSVSTFAEIEQQDRPYWLRQSPQARLRAMELMRWINYGDAVSGRLQRVFEVLTLEELRASDRPSKCDDGPGRMLQ